MAAKARVRPLRDTVASRETSLLLFPDSEFEIAVEASDIGGSPPELLRDLSLGVGGRGYARDFYGADDGAGAGAGSRRYEELEGGYLAGGYNGLDYGQDRAQRDFTGSPR